MCNDAFARHWVVRASFLGGLGAGEGGFELPHGPGHAVP